MNARGEKTKQKINKWKIQELQSERLSHCVRREHFHVNMLSVQWKVRASDDMFGYLIYLNINVILC